MFCSHSARNIPRLVDVSADKKREREREREREKERVNFADVIYRIVDDFSITAMRLSRRDYTGREKCNF